MKGSKAEGGANERPDQCDKKICSGCEKAHLPKKCYWANRACTICSGIGHAPVMCRHSEGKKRPSFERIEVDVERRTENDAKLKRPVSGGNKASVRGESKREPHKLPKLNTLRTKAVRRINSCWTGRTDENDFQIRVDFESLDQVPMQVDTGAEITVLSEETWKMLGEPSLSSADCTILCPNDSELPCFGMFEPEIKFGKATASGVVYVTSSSHNLIGKELIRGLNLLVRQV